MKKIRLFILILFVFAGFANAQTLLTENFSYTAGDSLRAHGWNITGASFVNTVMVVSPGLTYPLYPLSGIGNAAGLQNTGQDVNKGFSDSVSSGSVYASVMVNLSAVQATGDYFMHFGIAVDNSSIFMARVFAKLDAGNISFGISKSSTSATIVPTYTAPVYTTNTTHLLVIKYTFGPDNFDDEVALFVNPVLTAVEPLPTVTHDSSANADPAVLKTFNLRQGTGSNAPTGVVDGIKVGRTWVDIVPVELTSFTASANGNSVSLKWQTASETNNKGFQVERKSVNGTWKSISFVEGNGTTSESKYYSYTDNVQQAGQYSYRLKQVDFSGAFEYSQTAEVEVVNPGKFELAQNYPNPFNPSTKINFTLPEASNVKLAVYNMLGQEVRSLVNGFFEAGTHSINFNAAGLNSGMYFYKIEAGNFNQVRKMTLIK